jgi:serine/threonine protein kinase
MSADSRLDEVYGSVADGQPVDWTTLESHTTDDTRELVEQLRIVSELARVHRLLEEPPSTDRTTIEFGGRQADPAVLHWGRYTLVEKLGTGTFGTVYRAWDPELERHIAIKLLHTHHGVTPSLKGRMLQEGRAIAKVSHPNVVSVFGVEVHDDRVGLCMELVKGKTLDEIVRTQGTLSAREAATVGEAVCRALAAVHGATLVHRDVKARNVMREDGGRIVLMDFGTGQTLTSDEAEDRPLAAGTPIYMPPEGLAGGGGSVAGDIYSTGVLLFFLVSGRYPFEGATVEEVARAHATGRRRFVTEHRPDLPTPFVRAIERAIDPLPERRQPSAASLLVELLNLLDNAAVVAEPGPSPWQQLVGLVSKDAARTAFVGAAALLLLSVLGFLTSFTYSNALGLDDSFAHDGPLSSLKWGLKSLVAPLALMTGVSLVVLVASEVVKLVRRVSTVTDRACRRGAEVLIALVEQTGLPASSALACLVVVLSVTFAGWVIFGRFAVLLAAVFTPIDQASTEVLSRLAPSNELEHNTYRKVLSLGVLAMIFGWTIVVQVAARRGERLRHLLVRAGAVTTLVTIVLLDIPYRVLWHNEAEKVEFKGAQCYAVADRGDAVRLFCPHQKPRSVVVPIHDPGLVRSGILENIFTPFSRGQR